MLDYEVAELSTLVTVAKIVLVSNSITELTVTDVDYNVDTAESSGRVDYTIEETL